MPPIETTYVGAGLPSRGIHTWAHLASKRHFVAFSFFLFFFFSFLASLSFDFTRYRHTDKHSRVSFFLFLFFERVSPFRSTFVKKDACVCPLIRNIRNMEISLVCNKMPFIREFHAVTIDRLIARPSDLCSLFAENCEFFRA